jgi:sec-independent protein translocase protein TatB
LVSIDPEKLLFIFIIAVLVLGPDRLPQAARTMGRVLGEVRKYVSGFQSEVSNVLAEPKAMIEAAAREADMRSHLHRDLNGSSPAAEFETASATSGLDAGAAPAAGTALDGVGIDGPVLNGGGIDGVGLDGVGLDGVDGGPDGAGETRPSAPSSASTRAHLHRPELVAPSTPAGAPDDPTLN